MNAVGFTQETKELGAMLFGASNLLYTLGCMCKASLESQKAMVHRFNIKKK